MNQATKFKELGNKEFSQRNFPRAIQLYTQAISICENEVFYVNRAACYLAIDEIQKSISDTTRAIQLNPLYAKSYIRQYEAYMRIGDFSKARQILQQGRQQCPNDVSINRELDSSSILVEYKSSYLESLEEKNNTLEAQIQVK